MKKYKHLLSLLKTISNEHKIQPITVPHTSLFKSEGRNATALQILQGQKLQEHITKVPAVLICIVGEVIFDNEKNQKVTLFPGNYVHIEPLVIHWIEGTKESQLILLK